MYTYDIESGEKLLDSVSWTILRELQEDARISYSELGRRVGLSAPAVAERVRRMEDAGMISGYHASVNLEKVGLPVVAYIRLSTNNPNAHEVISRKIHNFLGILECHRVTGDDCYIIKVAVPSIQDIEKVIDQFGSFGRTTTAIVLSSSVCDRVIDQELLSHFQVKEKPYG